MRDKKRILIVDDEPSLALIVQRVLLKEGYEVAVAYDGFECLRKAVEERPDLIILDIMMPNMDGYQVGQRLRQDAGTAKIPIIFLSARGKIDRRIQPDVISLAEQVRAFDECQACDFLNKPVRADELVRAVNSTLWLSEQLA